MSRPADAPQDTDSPFADPALRLAAVVLDSAVGMAPLLVLIPLGAATGVSSLIRGSVIAFAVLQPILFVVNLVLLHRYGQTVGKRLVGLRIVQADGARATLGRIFFRRILFPGFLGAIPLLGWLFLLGDALCIFTDGRQTLHDRIADTIVVDLRRMPPQPPKKF